MITPWPLPSSSSSAPVTVSEGVGDAGEPTVAAGPPDWMRVEASRLRRILRWSALVFVLSLMVGFRAAGDEDIVWGLLAMGCMAAAILALVAAAIGRWIDRTGSVRRGMLIAGGPWAVLLFIGPLTAGDGSGAAMALAFPIMSGAGLAIAAVILLGLGEGSGPKA